MDIRDCVEKFILNPWNEIEIPTENPESSRVILWRYLKQRREAVKDFSSRISIAKKEKSIVLRKYKDLADESIVTLKDGSKVSLSSLTEEPSQVTKDYCQKMRDHVKGILPSWDEIELPTEEKINGWDIPKVDKEMFLKTLNEIKKEQKEEK